MVDSPWKKDLGLTKGVTLHMDSSAALSLVQRTGLNRAKHIEIQHLWIQHATNEGRVRPVKIWGAVNPADLMTKQ